MHIHLLYFPATSKIGPSNYFPCSFFNKYYVCNYKGVRVGEEMEGEKTLT